MKSTLIKYIIAGDDENDVDGNSSTSFAYKIPKNPITLLDIKRSFPGLGFKNEQYHFRYKINDPYFNYVWCDAIDSDDGMVVPTYTSSNRRDDAPCIVIKALPIMISDDDEDENIEGVFDNVERIRTDSNRHSANSSPFEASAYNPVQNADGNDYFSQFSAFEESNSNIKQSSSSSKTSSSSRKQQDSDDDDDNEEEEEDDESEEEKEDKPKPRASQQQPRQQQQNLKESASKSRDIGSKRRQDESHMEEHHSSGHHFPSLGFNKKNPKDLAAAASKMAANSTFGKFLKKGALTAMGLASEMSGSGSLPSKKQAVQLENLAVRLNTKFTRGYESHEELLQSLWNASNPSSSEDYEEVGPVWKQLGFENEDPSVDIRGAGVLGLECLIYLATSNAKRYHEMLNGQMVAKKSKEIYYPFVKAAMNITYALAKVVHIAAEEQEDDNISSTNFYHTPTKFWKLFNEPFTFFELFTILFRLMDDNWRRYKTEYDFLVILEKAVTDLQQILNESPSNIDELWQATNGLGFLLS